MIYNTTKNPIRFYNTYLEAIKSNKICECCFDTIIDKAISSIYYFQWEVDQVLIDDIRLFKLFNNTISLIMPNSITHEVYVLNGKKYVVIKLDLNSYPNVAGTFLLNLSWENENESVSLYSTPIKICENRNLTNITWKSTCTNVGQLIYPTNFIHSYFFDAKIVPTEPTYEEEVEENGEGDLKPTFQIVKQKYLLEFECTVLMAEAFSILSLHNEIRINGDVVKDIIVKIEYNDRGCSAIVSITYGINNVFKTACCNSTLQLAQGHYHSEHYSYEHYSI